MKKKIRLANYEDLTDLEKEDASNNGGGKEYASYLILEDDSSGRRVYSDAMEPEDVRFYRDLSWVIEEFKNLGYRSI